MLLWNDVSDIPGKSLSFLERDDAVSSMQIRMGGGNGNMNNCGHSGASSSLSEICEERVTRNRRRVARYVMMMITSMA